MIKKFEIIIIILIFNFFNSNLYALQNKIVAKVGNATVSSYDLKNKIRTSLVLSNQEINQNNINKIKNLSLNGLINLRIKAIETSKYNIQIDQKEIFEQLKRISLNDIDNFKNKFEINGLDYNIFLEELSTELKWQKLIFSLYSEKITIDDSEIDKNVEKIKNQNLKKKQFKLSEIEISIDDMTDISRLEIELKDFIKKTNFNEAAKKFSISPTASDGGNLGWIDKMSLSKDMFKVIEKMKLGEISKPIKKFNTVTFYTVSDIREIDNNNKDVEKIREKFVNRARNELFKLYSNNHLSKKKNNIFIEFK